ncbi:MAG: hypothetical protein GAK30_00443 [Paracidovorax wautersii]|uniref:Glucitol operon activator protein n=1 Tax=Paracidovorax wautersii TaxID=1177982 RepID=A0A7V8FRR2_9BURK|nr:MAG: hypothetical protein GAK30_00443 [Paracidovorax wautersii]
MTFLQSALLLLGIFWALQIVATWVQWSHYRQAMGGATTRWRDGYLGVGRGRSRWGRSAIALLEVSPTLDVRGLQVMSGLSVFARFRPEPVAQALSLDALRRQYAEGPRAGPLQHAVRQAIEQVEEVHRRR